MSPATTDRRPADGLSAPGIVGDLDWLAFQARFFPGKRPRQDFKAVVAYGTYRQAGEPCPMGSPGTAGDAQPVVSAHAADSTTTATGVSAERAAFDTWADGGGATRNDVRQAPVVVTMERSGSRG